MLPRQVDESPATDTQPLHPSPIPIPISLLHFWSDARTDEARVDPTLHALFVGQPWVLIYQETGDGIRRVSPAPAAPLDPLPGSPNSSSGRIAKDLAGAIKVRRHVCQGSTSDETVPLAEALDGVASDILILPRSERWREAISTALIGDWATPLFHTGHLPASALGALKAEARSVHRQLVPVWRRRTRHGRVLSLDAELGDGLSLYDLVSADVDLLTRVTEGVFQDARLNAVLRGLTAEERRVVLARAYLGGTWTEAAAAADATEPKAFGEHVRRKVLRLAAEQRRRLAQRSAGTGTFTRTS